MTKKRIAVVCGASAVTCTIISGKLKRILGEHNVEAEIIEGLTVDAAKLAQNADMIVTTVFLRTDYGVPVVNGVPFLTGVNVEGTIQQILDILTD